MNLIYRVLKRFELENYLFDKEILSKYCESKGDLTFDEAAYDEFVTDINNQNIKDDVKSYKKLLWYHNKHQCRQVQIESLKTYHGRDRSLQRITGMYL